MRAPKRNPAAGTTGLTAREGKSTGEIPLAISILSGRSQTPPVAYVAARPLELIVREGRLTVTPELAQRILDEANYDRQRPVKAHHVTLLAEDMRRDRWTPGSQIAFAKVGERLQLINGQHRMHAVVESRRPIEFQILVAQAETETELHALYYRFDRRQRPRSTSEVLNALGIADKHGMSKTMTQAVFEAALVISNRFTRPNYQKDPVSVRSDDARLASASAWWETGKLYEDLIREAPPAIKGKLTNGSVVAVALVTLKYQPEIAAQFWRGLADNDGLRRSDPRHTLLTDLASRSMHGRGMVGAQAAALAWNAFFDRRPLKLIKVYEGHAVRVQGTPFDGRRA